MEHLKTCTVCLRTLPIDDFYVNHRSPDGHSPSCKECVKAYQKLYRDRQRRRALMPKKYTIKL